MVAAGVREYSAVPFKPLEEEVTLRHLVVALDSEIRLAHRAAVARDGAIWSLLWRTKLRGADLGALRLRAAA